MKDAPRASRGSSARPAGSAHSAIDKIPIGLYALIILLDEGRSREASSERSGMRRLRVWFAATHSGGAGAPPGVTRDPCQELADRMWRARENSSPRQCILREARPGADKTPPMVRREAAMVAKADMASKGLTCVCRRTVVPHPLLGCTRASRGDQTWLFENR